jgi:hypothetical protein
VSLFDKTKVGKIIKVTSGLLVGKYVMIAKEFKKGYGVIADQSDWPSDIPLEYNALYVEHTSTSEVTEEEETLIKLKFPNAEQFE